MACGFGRNAAFLASKYEAVIAGDYDPDVFADGWYREFDNIVPVLLNGRRELPFQDGAFDLVTVVHFYDDNLLRRILLLLREEGVVLIESVGNHGENWRELPRLETLEAIIRDHCELISFKSRAIKKAPDYSTFTLVAKKKAS
jgi:SAM-dependent methyltransferase